MLALICSNQAAAALQAATLAQWNMLSLEDRLGLAQNCWQRVSSAGVGGDASLPHVVRNALLQVLPLFCCNHYYVLN